MIPSLGLSLILQVLCVVHLMRTGRNPLWLAALIFLPGVGPLAYCIVEILPGFFGSRRVRTVRSKAVAVLDPEREVRAARDALDLADTVANRLRLADALTELGRYGEALPLLREAIERGPPDMRAGEKLARALFETGDAGAALAALDGNPPATLQSDRDRQALLRARILEALARPDEALLIYADIVTRLPGEEARCRYAALLIEQGRDREALVLLEEVESRMKRLDRHQRAREADMYRWAMGRLAALRAKG